MMRFWATVVALLLALAASPAAASAGEAESATTSVSCRAYGTLDLSIAEALADAGRWTCGPARPDIGPERAFLRFEIDPAAPQPTSFITRRSTFGALTLSVIDADGTIRSRRYTYDDTEPAFVGYLYRLDLPEVTADSRAVVAAFDLPTQRISLEQAHITAADPIDDPANLRMLIFVAAICGMLMMPLLFNGVFYRVLRQPFVLWHAAMCLTALLQVTNSSGILAFVIPLPAYTISVITVLGYSAFTATAAMFANSYLEPDKLHPTLRRALRWTAPWAIAAGVLHVSFPYALRPYTTDLYYLAFLPILAIFVLGLIDALRRGSRAARFQLVGWLPLLALGATRLVSHLLPLGPATDAMMLFYLAILCDVLATTLGVADRFMAIKRDRDRAKAQARVAEDISERDPLTGLLNRRAIEPRFSKLYGEGFDTLAVIDLDRFKSINDQYGHGKGDEVLRAAASALTANDDTLAMRLGGEEFLLLLRGKDAMARAERCRRAISARIAAEVDGLDRMVTASMGVVQIPLETMPDALFADLYARADRLLYEAKEAGRNRMVSEKLTAFARRGQDRRRAPRRKAATG